MTDVALRIPASSACSATPATTRDPTERSAMRLFESRGSTLEDAILGAWEDLLAGGPAECPVCGGEMRPAGGCESCGSDLS